MDAPRFQFSIRRLLGVTAIVAAIGALAAEPGPVSGASLILLVCAFPAALAAGLVRKPGCWKAFCAGAIIPAGAAMYDTVGHYLYHLHPRYSLAEMPLILEAFENVMTNSGLRPHVGLLWTAMLVMGLASAGVFWASGADRSGDT